MTGGTIRAQKRDVKASLECAFLATALDLTPAAIAVAEAPSGRIVQENHTFADLFPESAPGMDLAERVGNRLYHPDGRPAAPELSARALQGEDVGRKGFRLRRSGSWINVEVRVHPVRGRDGSLLGSMVAVEDVSVRQRRERERDLFLGVLGHDLRSPLQSIRLGAEILLREESLPPRAAQIAGRMFTSGGRMTALVDLLLELARIRFGCLELSPERIDLADLCENVVSELDVVWPDRSIALHRRGDTSGLWDRARLEQIVNYVVQDALEHGEPDAPVSLYVVQIQDRVVLEVTHLSPPISDEPPDLALYVSRAIVAAHGGSLDFESDESATKCRLCLPRRGHLNV